MNSASSNTFSSIAQEQLEAKRAENPKEVRGLSAQEEKLLALRQEYKQEFKKEPRKDSFKFYPTYYKHIKALARKEDFVSEGLQFFECICEYALYGNEPNLAELPEDIAELWEETKEEIDGASKKNKKPTENQENQEKGFSFLRSHFETIQVLEGYNTEWLSLFEIYCYYGMNLKEPEENQIQSLSKIAKVYWVKDKPHIIANWIKCLNGNKGGKFGGVRKNNIPQADPTNTPPLPQADPTNTPSEPQPLSKGKIKEKIKDNIKREYKENCNEVASSLSQGNYSSCSSPIPTLEEIEKFVLSEHLYVMPERFFDYYNKMQWRGVNDWRTRAREWSENEKQVNDEDLLQLEKRVEQRENKACYDALWGKIGSYKVSIDEKVGKDEWQDIDEIKFLSLIKEGCTEQQIIDSYKLVADMGFIYRVKGSGYNYGDIRGVIKSYSMIKERWDIVKPLHSEFLRNLYEEGIEQSLLKQLNREGFFCLYCDTAEKNISLLYKTLRKANENPQGFNSWLDIMQLCEQLKAQDIEK